MIDDYMEVMDYVKALGDDSVEQYRMRCDDEGVREVERIRAACHIVVCLIKQRAQDWD